MLNLLTPSNRTALVGVILVGAIVGTVAYGVYQLATLGHTDPALRDIFEYLVGLLLALRHANDLKNGNGSSGLTPPTPPK